MNDSQNNEISEVEVIETDAKKQDAVITYGGAGMPETFHSDEEMNKAIEIIERRNTFITKITKMALKTLMPTDFHDFNGTPYLQGIGAQRLVKYLGISVANTQRIPAKGYEIIEEDTEKRLRVTYQGDFSLGILHAHGVGIRDTHNKLLCKTSAGYKELKAIELPDLDRSAKTAMYADGVSILIGLKKMTWEYLEDLGFTPDKTTGHTYGKGTRGGDASGSDPETKKQKTDIGNMLLEMANGEKETAAQMLENYTAWTKDGKDMKGNRELSKLTAKQAPVIYGKVKTDYDNFIKKQTTGIENAEPPPDDSQSEIGF